MLRWKNAWKADTTCGGGRMTPELLIGSITLFVLSIFLGFELITKVPATLHTPLMSGANAISGISIVGALIGANVAYDAGDTAVSYTHLTLPTICSV